MKGGHLENPKLAKGSTVSKESLDPVRSKGPQYLCFLCLKDGRTLSMKNIDRHFAEVHNAEPKEEVNWCHIGNETSIKNS
jgi:hypothetical protein